MNPHLRELIALLQSHDVEFLVVGSTCLALHARPRFTEYIDLWVRNSVANVDRLHAALKEFGLDLDKAALQPFIDAARQVLTLGARPSALDLLNFLDGLTFDSAWSNRIGASLDGLDLSFLSLEDFVRAKRAAGRPKDVSDLDILAEVVGEAKMKAIQ